MKLFRAILRNSKGATAIEYGLIATFIAIAIIAALILVGGSVSDSMNGASNGFN